MFIIPPYDLAKFQTNEDIFNFFKSSTKIIVECAFGEIDLRWEIFWRRLTTFIVHSFIICEGVMCLHNFLVDYRNENVTEIRQDLDPDLAAHL